MSPTDIPVLLASYSWEDGLNIGTADSPSRELIDAVLRKPSKAKRRGRLALEHGNLIQRGYCRLY